MRAPEFWSGRGSGAKILSTLLTPLGCLYAYSVRVKQARAHPHRAKARVVCVGNLTAGGSGKTPVAIALGRSLMARGLKIVFLSRGFGGDFEGPVEVDVSTHTAADVGDEPLLLAATAETVVSRDRAKGAALCDALGADIIVMDDGHQNFQIVKDFSVVVVSGKEGFGNGKVIPAGPLREPVAEGLARADAVIQMGRGNPAIPFNGPVLRARAFPNAPEWLRGEKVFAFAGIADPKRFFDLVRDTGANLVGAQTFSDHHPFTSLEISVLRLASEKLGARLVTTEKDYVRLDPGIRDGIAPIPVSALFDDETQAAALLDSIAGPRNKATA
jgi:tetraacyldisaccharide 4'-kinase